MPVLNQSMLQQGQVGFQPRLWIAMGVEEQPATMALSINSDDLCASESGTRSQVSNLGEVSTLALVKLDLFVSL